jgi:hypothetical protein
MVRYKDDKNKKIKEVSDENKLLIEILFECQYCRKAFMKKISDELISTISS